MGASGIASNAIGTRPARSKGRWMARDGAPIDEGVQSARLSPLSRRSIDATASFRAAVGSSALAM